MTSSKISRAALRALRPGEKLTVRGIIAEVLEGGDVRYSVQVMVDGERIARVLGRQSEGVTPTQAERFLESLRTRAREARLELPKGRKTALSFAEAAPRYLGLLEAGAGKNIDRKRQHLRTYLIPHFGRHRLNAIHDPIVEAYVQRRNDASVAASTINGELATLSHLLKTAVKAKWIGRDALPEIPRQRPGRGRIVALSDTQSTALLDAAVADQDPDLWLFVLIGLQTSMRHGEIRRLRWDNFDANRKRFFIPQSKAGEREQPITSELTQVLVAECAQRQDQTGYLFAPGPGSNSPFRHTFRKAFRRAADRAGLDPDLITPHVMRHTAITRLVKAGVDLPTIQKVSGHRTLSMILKYTHVDGLHVDNATEALSLPFRRRITSKLPVGLPAGRGGTEKTVEKVVRHAVRSEPVFPCYLKNFRRNRKFGLPSVVNIWQIWPRLQLVKTPGG